MTKGPAEGFFAGHQLHDVMVECQKSGIRVYIGSLRNATVRGIPVVATADTVVLGVDGDGIVHSFHRYTIGESIAKMGW